MGGQQNQQEMVSTTVAPNRYMVIFLACTQIFQWDIYARKHGRQKKKMSAR